MWERAYAWAREQVGEDLAKALGSARWQRFAEREELSTTVDSSIWGPQLHEAWVSGEAVQTGDPDFDLAFVVLGADAGVHPQAEQARLITKDVRVGLLALANQLRDSYIFPDRVRVRVDRSGDLAPSEHKQHPFAWAMGRAFLRFDRMLTAKELHAGLSRAVEAARKIEQAAIPE